MSTKKSKKNNSVADAATVAVIAANELQPDNISIANVINDSQPLTMSESAVVPDPVTEDMTTDADTAIENAASSKDAETDISLEQHPAENIGIADIANESRLLTLSDEDAKILEGVSEKLKKYALNESNDATRLGKQLIKAKEVFGKYGEWQNHLKDWLAAECDFSMRTARRFMQIAKVIEKKPELKGLPITKIETLNRLNGGKKKREEFLREHNPVNLSTRKLEELVQTANNGGKPPVAKPVTKKTKPIKIESLEETIGKLFEQLNNTQDDSEKNATYDKLRLLCQQTLENISMTDI